MPPSICRSRPVAVTIRSASSSVPDSSAMPFSVKLEMRSVTIDALPLRTDWKKSPSGTMHKPLLPGLVAGREVRGDVVVGAEVAAQHPHQVALEDAGPGSRQLEDERLQQHEFQSADGIRQLVRKQEAKKFREFVLGRAVRHVGWRALQHRHVGGLPGQRRDQRHRRRAAADHDNALALVVDVLGPLLGVDDASLESFDAGEIGRVAVGVVEVAGAHVQEAAGVSHGLRSGPRSTSTVHRHRPTTMRPGAPDAGSGCAPRCGTRGRFRRGNSVSIRRRRWPSARSTA